MGRRTRVVALLAAAGFSGCAPKEVATPMPEITITATDFALAAPDTVVGGLTRVHFVNQGKQAHHAQFVRLNDNVTYAQFDSGLKAVAAAAAKDGDAAFAKLFEVASLDGGAPPAMAGESRDVVVDLPAGNYLLTCFMSDADGVPHIMKGMAKPVVVTAAAAKQPAAPVAQATVVLKDFAFDSVPAFKSGKTLVEVKNAGKEAHEFAIIRLKGITAQQFASMMASPPPPPKPGVTPPPLPFEYAGGYQGIMPGQHGWTTVDLTAADYVLVCFIPSPGNQGKPHVMMGMFKPFTVS